MRQALFHGPGDVRLVEVPVPSPGAGEVLVKVEVTLVCGTDAKTYRRGHPVLLTEAPAPFGHEYSGTIVETGEGVSNFRVGDRVTSANSAPCGHCFFCRRDQFSLCEHLQPLLNGAYADYLLVSAPIVAVNMFRVPEGMPAERAALLEPLACVLKGLEVGNPGPGVSVAIIGLGPIGLMLAYGAASRGARVIAVGRGEHKLEAARRMGAEHVIDSDGSDDALAALRALTEEERGVDLAVEAVGLPEVWDFTIAAARKGGTVNFFGGCEEGSLATVDTYRLHYEELTLAATFHHTPRHVRFAMALLKRPDLPHEVLITHRYPLEELVLPLRMMSKELPPDPAFIKAAVVP